MRRSALDQGLGTRFAAMTSRPVVCVTGASAGIGRAIALAFAAEWGAAIGLIFPPSILVGGLLGAGTGALIGHLEGGMSRSDLKEVGEMLDNSEAALIVVGEATLERAVEDATKRAKRDLKKEIRADAREVERAVDQA